MPNCGRNVMSRGWTAMFVTHPRKLGNGLLVRAEQFELDMIGFRPEFSSRHLHRGGEPDCPRRKAQLETTIRCSRSQARELRGSNPTPGALGQTPYIESRLIQKIELSALSEIINFGLWMRKQSYRPSTVKYCLQALKSRPNNRT
jgi:hypothetical protein